MERRMRRKDREAVARWLEDQCRRLERLPHYPRIRRRVEKLRAEASRLYLELDGPYDEPAEKN